MFGLISPAGWAADLYVNDEYIEEDPDADPPVPPERDTLGGDCSNANYETIAEALEDAQTGDTIILCDCIEWDDAAGVDTGSPDLVAYTPELDATATILIPEDIESITIKSAFGPDYCIVSGTSPINGAVLPVVRLDFAEQELTLGDPMGGGGMTITGGAAPQEDIYPPFDEVYSTRGGALRNMAEDGLIEAYECLITGNQAYDEGGAVYCHFNATVTVVNCTITGNVANAAGGAIYCEPGGTVNVFGGSIDSNVSGLMGGGICAPEGASVELTAATMCGNYAPADPMSGTPHQPLHSKNIWGAWTDGGDNCIAVDCGVNTECDENADVWDVPGDFATIQAAINAAGPGDTIQVDPGTYFEFLDLEGKAITLTARDPAPGMTIIDPRDLTDPDNPFSKSLWGQSSVIKFTSGESDTTVVSGFTLQGGTGEFFYYDALNPYGALGVGGGILCHAASPVIDSCVIRDNDVSAAVGPGNSGEGGGVYSGGQSEPELTGTTYLCNNLPNHLFGYVQWVDACEAPTCEDVDGDNIPDSCQGVPQVFSIDMDSGETAIADAIAVANSGDTIELAAGTYTETINPLGKPLTFKGAGADQTILDGQGADQLIRCVAGETDGTTFEDLTITGGGGSTGGAVYLKASSPVFRNVNFIENHATSKGGAVHMSDGGRPTFENCRFEDNISDWVGGAINGVNVVRPVFTDTIFLRNSTGLVGGAVSMMTVDSGTPPSYPVPYPHGLIGCQPSFTNCNFSTNRALRYGGAVFAGFATAADFENCAFENNVAEWGGGGFFIQSIYAYADIYDGSPPQSILESYYPHIHTGSYFACCEPTAISGDAQAWYDPWWGDAVIEGDCLVCAPDINKDLVVDFFDLAALIGAWGNCEDANPGDPNSPPLPVLCDADLDGNYVVDVQDLILVLEHWNKDCPVE
jgi:hypothetical protein